MRSVRDCVDSPIGTSSFCAASTSRSTASWQWQRSPSADRFASPTVLAPRVGKRLKERLQVAMDAKFGRFIECLAMQKTRMKERHPGAAQSKLRRKAMIDAADGFDAIVAFSYPAWFEDELRSLGPDASQR
jgi:hypothetical protein